MSVNAEQLLELQTVMPFRWRVGSGVGKGEKNKNNKTIYQKYRVLAYIDSRDVMDKLDTICGPLNRTRGHQEIKGSVYCGVSINTEVGRVTKRDVGSESNIEGAKGASSDSFKRACVNRGIGRFLYTVPTFTISKHEAEKNAYNMTPYIRQTFEKELKKRYENNSIKLEYLESKYEEFRSIPEQEVSESIEDVVDLEKRKKK